MNRPDNPLQRPTLVSVEGPDVSVELTSQEILRLGLTATAVVAGIGPSAFTVTTNPFLMPPNGGNATVTVDSSAFTTPGAQVLIAGAGWFNVVAIPDGQTLSLTALFSAQLANAGDTVPENALVTPVGPIGTSGPKGDKGDPGTAVVTTVVGPTGQTGQPGAPGLSASTLTLAPFTMPANGETVGPIPVGSSQWISPNADVFVADAGWFSVSTIPDASDFSLTALNASQVAPSGSIIPSGKLVSPCGPQGIPGTGGTGTGPTGATGPSGPPGVPPYSVTTNPFIMPLNGDTVAVPVSSVSWLAPGEPVFVAFAGAFVVSSVPSPFQLNLTALAVNQLASAGASIPSGALVTASGFPGQNGAPGLKGDQGIPGQNTTLVETDAFQIPAGGDYAVTGTLMQSVGGPLTTLNQSTVTVTAHSGGSSGPVVWTKRSPEPDVQIPPATTGLVNMIFRPTDTAGLSGSNLFVAVQATDPGTGIAWPVGNFTVQVL